jgi:hypothetical protein
MGTSWIKRHAHEEPDRRKSEKDRYNKWKAQFCTMNGNTLVWDDRKVKAWMEARKT